MMPMPEARAGWNKVSLLFLNKFSGFAWLPFFFFFLSLKMQTLFQELGTVPLAL